ncbi:hypothetical protein SD78_1786 [Bacillus badius]|nr:hypothetical protein SD78_1786 [Bacillus badius]
MIVISSLAIEFSIAFLDSVEALLNEQCSSSIVQNILILI